VFEGSSVAIGISSDCTLPPSRRARYVPGRSPLSSRGDRAGREEENSGGAEETVTSLLPPRPGVRALPRLRSADPTALTAGRPAAGDPPLARRHERDRAAREAGRGRSSGRRLL